MNQLKHILGIPITLPNKLALKGSTHGRFAASNGRDPKIFKKILIATGDSDDSTEPKVSSKSYATLIADYSKAIETHNAVTKLNGDSKISRAKGFFSKTTFYRLARVSSFVNIKNVGNNGGSSLCTKSSSRPPSDSIKKNDKTYKSKGSQDNTQVLNQVNKRAEWLDHVVRAHNAKRMTKNDVSLHNCDQGNNLAHYLVQRLPESCATSNAIPNDIDDTHSSSLKKSPDTSASDVNNIMKLRKRENTIPKSTSDTSIHHSSSIKKLRDNSSSDAIIVSSKSSTTGNSNAKSFSNSIERYCSSVKTKSETLTNDAKNVSIVVQRLQKTDKTRRELSGQNSEDSNAMLMTVTEESKSYSTSKSSPLRYIDLRINGKPAAGVNTVISKVNKLDVVSSAEKIEITIPVLSKTGGAIIDNARVPNSMINLCISSQGKECKRSNDVGYMDRAGQIGDSMSESSKSGLTQPWTLIASKIQNPRNIEASFHQSKVVPWWTTIESFRRSEIVSVRSTEMATINRNIETKMSGVGKMSASGNQEAHDRKVKEVAVSDAEKALKFVVTEPSSSSQQQYKRKRSSVISKIIANDSQKKSERDEQERQTHKQVTLGRSKSDAKPEAKADTKVTSTASNEPKKESTPLAIGSTMPGKSARASTPTPDNVSKKMASSSGSTVAASKGNSTSSEFQSNKELDTSRNNNLWETNNFQERFRVKPISELTRGNNNVSTEGEMRSTGHVAEGRASNGKEGSKIGAKPRQEVISKSETNTATQLPRTYGKIRLLPSSQSPVKPVYRANNNRCVSIKQSDGTAHTGDKLSKLKNTTITMRPIEKKKDGTLIDYGLTVNTRKKPERKLSESGNAAGLQGKKLMRQKEAAVIATVKEVMPRRNRDTRSNAIKPRSIEDTARSMLNDPDKNRQRRSETREISPCRPKNTASKGTINEPNESKNSRTFVKSEKRNSKDSNESQVVETAGPDKKLLYSVWLRRFKERTGQDPDPKKDPSSRNS